jgi:uncharacterized protein YabE (DUF348 family)
LRVRKAIGNVALASAVLAVAGGYLAIQKTVTLVLEGRPEAVRTMSSNVGELLDAEGISLGFDDLVVPSQNTPIVDGMTVFVDQGFVSAAAGWKPPDVGVWVMDGVTGPSAMLSARHTEDWFSTEPVGWQSVVAAHVVVMGKDHDVLTNATSVGELLSAMGIEPDRSDRVLPSPSAPLSPNATIRFVSIDVRVRERRVPIPYTVSTRYTDELRPGQIRTLRAGLDGLLLERYRLRIVNGRVVERDLLGREVLREAVAAQRLVGREESQLGGVQVGEASWYSFAPGDGLTAAHPWLPFGTVVTVTNLANGRTVQVVINDRGPFGGRIIDLSDQAFAAIAPLGQGVCQVRLAW